MPNTNLVDKDTNDSISISIVSDGGKNTVFLITGKIENETDSVFDIIDVSRLAGNPTSVRLDSILFMVETGLRVITNYRDKPYTIPLEGRGKTDLSWVGGLTGHEVDMVFKGVGSFFIVLDVSKMGV